MTSTPNPTWYDVLGVSRDATPGGDQGRLAQRHRQVRAGLRLRPVPDVQRGRRRAARPGAARGVRRRRSTPSRRRAGGGAEPVRAAPPPPAPADDAAGRAEGASEPRERRREAATREPAGEPASRPGRVDRARRAGAADRGRAGRSPASSALQVRTGRPRSPTPATRRPAAAERAVKAVFAYDYRHLAGRPEAGRGLPDRRLQKEYLKNFDALEKQKDGTPGPGRADQGRGHRRRARLGRGRRRRRTRSGSSSSSTWSRSKADGRPADLPEPGRDDHGARTATAGWSQGRQLLKHC